MNGRRSRHREAVGAAAEEGLQFVPEEAEVPRHHDARHRAPEVVAGMVELGRDHPEVAVDIAQHQEVAVSGSGLRFRRANSSPIAIRTISSYRR